MEAMPLLNLQLSQSRNKDSNILSMKTFDYKRFSRQISTASKETSSLSPPKDKKKFLKLNLNDISILKKNTLIVNTKVLKTPQPLTRNKKFLINSMANKEIISLPKINEPHMIEADNLLDISFGLESPRREFHKMQTYAMKPKKIKIVSNKPSSNKVITLKSNYSNSPNKENKDYFSANSLNNKTKHKFHHHNKLKYKSRFNQTKFSSSTQVSTSPSHHYCYPKYSPPKISSRPFGNYIKSYAVNSYQGINRLYNEDKVTIILSVLKPKDFQGIWPHCSFIALYDGNGGSRCCDFLRDHLHHYIVKNPYFPQDPEKAITTAFEKANAYFIHHISTIENDTSISSALVLLLVNDNLFVANCGISKAIASINWGTITKDLISNSNNNSLNSFGCRDIKIEIKKMRMDNSLDFIILETSSIYNKVTNKECINIVWDKINNSNNESLHSLSGDAVDKIMKTALERKANENISCVLIGFNSLEQAFNQRYKVIEGYSYKGREYKPVSNI